MILRALHATNFRNFSKLTAEFDPNLSVLVGPNSSGKTNILEAVWLLALGKTFRPGSDFEMIKFGKNTAYVRGVVSEGSGHLKLEVGLQRADEEFLPRKRFSVNGVGKKMVNFVGNLKVVLFSPVDLELVVDSPSLRRTHLDDFLSQADQDYHRILSTYEKTVTSRNRLLERIFENRSKADELDFWDQALVKLGQEISLKREEFFKFLNKASLKLEDFSWSWRSSRVDLDKLKRERGRDIEARMTISGPHRDDFRFILSGRDLSFFGSRGQQRMSVLNLKLLELDYLEAKTDQKPILVLDDILSELDHDHRKVVLKYTGGQTILTTTDLANLEKKFRSQAKLIEVEELAKEN